jgi:uncharacterized membrane protein YedE/YeeE
MSFPIEFTGPASGLICGSLFGFALENGGMGSGCKMTGQLRLQDWTVFNLMFTAIIVSATGLYGLEVAGLMQAADLYTPTTFLWATLLGGGLVGVGMGVGGYCPGTSVVVACSGRVDGAFFFGGLLAGVALFANAYDWVKPLLGAAQGPEAQTLPQLLGVPGWVVLVMLAIVAAAVGGLTSRLGPFAPKSAMRSAASLRQTA